MVGNALKVLGLLTILASFGAYLAQISTMPGDPGKGPIPALLISGAIFLWGLATALAGEGIVNGKAWGSYLAFVLSFLWTTAHACALVFQEWGPNASQPVVLAFFLGEVAALVFFYRHARAKYLELAAKR